MSYTRSFIGESEFDRQALNLDPGQAGVPLWKVYDPRSEGMPSDLRYDLSGLGDFGRGGSALSMDLKQAGEDCAQATHDWNLAQMPHKNTPSYLLARMAEKMRARCAHYKSLQSGSTPDPRAPSDPKAQSDDDSEGLPKWALPAIAAVAVVGFVFFRR